MATISRRRPAGWAQRSGCAHGAPLTGRCVRCLHDVMNPVQPATGHPTGHLTGHPAVPTAVPTTR